MDASSLYNPPEKRQPDLKDFHCLGLKRALERALQPRYCARFGLKSGAVGILAYPKKTGSFLQVAALMAGGWGTVELAKYVPTGSSPCGGRARGRAAFLGWPRDWLVSQRLPRPSPIRCFEPIFARQPFPRPRKHKQRRVRLSLLVAARTASRVANGKAHP